MSEKKVIDLRAYQKKKSEKPEYQSIYDFLKNERKMKLHEAKCLSQAILNLSKKLRDVADDIE